jgi:methionine-S-sulfoxide reductase
MAGVVSAESGYTGGTQANPTYEQVGSGRTGHIEAVRVVYDPKRISYRQLVDRFWPTIDPTDDGGQFCDRGPVYRTAVFVTPAQRPLAEVSRTAAARKLKQGSMVTPIRPATRFWPAEAYHQDFYKKNPLRYRVYRQGCGRDARLRAVWGR